jgi:hypothetical protein
VPEGLTFSAVLDWLPAGRSRRYLQAATYPLLKIALLLGHRQDHLANL